MDLTLQIDLFFKLTLYGYTARPSSDESTACT